MYNREEEAVFKLIELSSRGELTWVGSTILNPSGEDENVYRSKYEDRFFQLSGYPSSLQGGFEFAANLVIRGNAGAQLSIIDEMNHILYDFKGAKTAIDQLWEIAVTGKSSISDFLDGLVDS